MLISGGVGITPLLSMAEYISSQQPDRKVHFIHSSSNKSVQPMLQRLRELEALNNNFSLLIHHSGPLNDELLAVDYDHDGRITKNSLPLDSHADYYVCGPVGLMENVFVYLDQLGVEKSRIHSESFVAERKSDMQQMILNSKSDSLMVKLSKSNKVLAWTEDNGTLLDLIESIGLNPESSCRMGTCATCESKLISGNFKYDPEPFLETANGHVLICCAKPTSDIELEL